MNILQASPLVKNENGTGNSLFSYSLMGKKEWQRMVDDGGLYPPEAHGGWVGWVLARRDINHRLTLPLDHEITSS